MRGAIGWRLERGYSAALLAIIVLAAVLRFYDLGDLPPGLFCDEAALGYNSYSILHGGRDENGRLLPLYVWSFGVSYKNPVFIYAAMGPIAALGLSEQSVRLTSALFGVAAVAGMAGVGRVVFGRAGALAAALLLALCPWHLHFSRIAFELISFPTFFLFAFAALARGVRGRPRSLLAAGILFGLTLYTYAPAKAFVPAFLLGAAVVYARRLWAMRRATAWALAAAVLTGLPAVIFDLRNPESSGQYFSHTTFWSSTEPLGVNFDRFLFNYRQFFSSPFLFERGEWIVRHSMPGFGELLPATAPLMAAGLVWALWRRHPEGKLLLWWLLLYPVAPALMNEIPSASRGIIGAPAFALLAAAGLTGTFAVVRRLLGDSRLGVGIQGAIAVAFAAALGVQSWQYWRAYVSDYPAAAAQDFQYGYRETIRFMEEQRPRYDLLLLTANTVNQPQIFTAFYNARPDRVRRAQDDGYLIIDPAEFPRYHMQQRVLAAVRPADLYLFADYEIVHRVVTPARQLEFAIIDAKSRRDFIVDWLILGPFENPDGHGLHVDYVNPADVTHPVSGALGPARWKFVRPQFVRVNFNMYYETMLVEAKHQVDWLCAYALTQIVSPTARPAALELGGASVPARAWVNGQLISKVAMLLQPQLRRWPIELQAGSNSLLLQVCKTGGDWFFTADVTDANGRNFSDLKIRPVLPIGVSAPPPAAPEAEGEAPHA